MVVGPEGFLTRYDQISAVSSPVFQGGLSTRSLWFSVDGVPAVVTIGDDAHWNELAELAAYRGAQLQFHLGSGRAKDEDAARVVAQETKPVLVVSIASVDRLLSNIGYLTRAAGTPEVGGLVTLMASQYIEGLDTTKPAGLMNRLRVMTILS